MARVLMIIPPERFRDEELFETRSVLEGCGHGITIASTRRGACPGSRGGSAVAERALTEVDPAGYDALVFVGGGGSTLLFNDLQAQGLARRAAGLGRVVAAICLAPVILANAGVLAGRRATVAGTKSGVIEAAGAVYTGPGVTVDGRIITANAPKASRLFGQRICEVLAGVPAEQP